MESFGWLLRNVVQAVFLGAWSVLWMTIASVGTLLTRDPHFGLRLAHTRWAPGLLWAAGARLDVRGLEKLDVTQACVFVVNHQSMIDIPVLQRALPVDLRFVLKRELMNVPFLGWYCAAVGMIPVDRGNTPDSVARLKRTGELIVREGAHVLGFAEGTRSRTGAIGTFKKGSFMLALQAQVPIVPISIEGARRVLPSDGFSVRPGPIHVWIGDPIPTTGLTVDDRDALMERAHAAVVAMNVAQGGVGATPMAIELAPARAATTSPAPARIR